MIGSRESLPNHRPLRRRRAAVALAAAGALVLASCGSDDDAADDAPTLSDGAAGSTGTTDVVTTDGSATVTADVVAQFYPLVFAAARVGGDLVDVSSLTPPGVEPHDLELTAQDTAALQEAGLIVFLDGFSAAVDDAIATVDSGQAFDVAPFARLDVEAGEDGHDHGDEDHDHGDEDHATGTTEHDDHADDHDHDHDETTGTTDHADHADDHDHDEATGTTEHDDHADDHDHGGVDPHFWLDPTRLADVADAIADRFGELDPANAEQFTANAAELRSELEALDAEFEAGLADCQSEELVTSHTAFAYLAERYGLTQVGILGISPSEEPSPQALAEIVHFVEDHGVTTIYTETLVDPAIAETVAAETGAETAVLDPLEGLSDDAAGADYFEVMRANLETLRTGQSCT